MEKLNEVKQALLAEVEALKNDLLKDNNKAASARCRKSTLMLEKLGKEYRKLSCLAEKK